MAQKTARQHSAKERPNAIKFNARIFTNLALGKRGCDAMEKRTAK